MAANNMNLKFWERDNLPRCPYDEDVRVLVLTHPRLLFLAESLPDQTEEYIEGVLNALKGQPGIESITVRPHPSENLDCYQQLVKGLGFNDVKVSKKGEYLKVMERHDIVIGTFSTATLQAAMKRRFTACQNWWNLPFPPPFDGLSIPHWELPVHRSQAELRDWLSKLFDNSWAYAGAKK